MEVQQGRGHPLPSSPRAIGTKSFALLACWGARVPGQSSGDPLTLATTALARGFPQILVT